MNPEWPKGPTEPVIQNVHKSKLGQDFESARVERPLMSDSEREQTDAKLVTLSTLMNASHLWWQLDGSLNLSLRKKEQGGDYIGVHSDIDISVLRDELPNMETYLKENGYGLFLQSKEGGNRNFRRVGYAAFARRLLDDVREKPYIAAIDAEGNIRTDTTLPRIQVSIVDIDSNGNPNERGLSYPKSWLHGQTTLLHDAPLVLSHPARHLLFKLWYMRDYDEHDIELWSEMNTLSSEELDTLERIIHTTAADPDWWEENKSFVKNADAIERRIARLRMGLANKD
jgi:hypothetical protein